MSDQPFRASGDRPADRYGDRPTTRRRNVLVGAAAGVLALVAVAWWVWIAAVQSSPPVRFELLGFQTVTASSVEIRFSVVRDPGASVACVLRARGADGAEVGRRQVLVPADGTERAELTSTVQTTFPAVTGEVLVCQPYEEPPGASEVRTTPNSRTDVADLLP